MFNVLEKKCTSNVNYFLLVFFNTINNVFYYILCNKIQGSGICSTAYLIIPVLASRVDWDCAGLISICKAGTDPYRTPLRTTLIFSTSEFGRNLRQ